jgi:ParB/RepB/Spo0J family partition protein
MSKNVQTIDINDIITNANQPRKLFDEEKIGELAESIKKDGLKSPILVRPAGNKYEIVQGERRFRATKHVGLTTVEAFVEDLSDDQAFHLAVIENIQREQLTPIEEAQAFKRYVELGLTHDQIAEKVSKSRTYVTSRLRLLKLIPEIQDMIAQGKISEGHAKQLMTLESVANRLCGPRIAKRTGYSTAYEELQYLFAKQFEHEDKITVKEVARYANSWRERFISAIYGRMKGLGSFVLIKGENIDTRVRGFCLEWDLKPDGVIKEDIHYLRDLELERNDGELKISEIYKVYEDIEEDWFNSVSNLDWPESEKEIDETPVFDVDLDLYYVFKDEEVSRDTTEEDDE